MAIELTPEEEAFILQRRRVGQAPTKQILRRDGPMFKEQTNPKPGIVESTNPTWSGRDTRGSSYELPNGIVMRLGEPTIMSQPRPAQGQMDPELAMLEAWSRRGPALAPDEFEYDETVDDVRAQRTRERMSELMGGMSNKESSREIAEWIDSLPSGPGKRRAKNLGELPGMRVEIPERVDLGQLPEMVVSVPPPAPFSSETEAFNRGLSELGLSPNQPLTPEQDEALMRYVLNVKK